jgi:uncharacterized protein DUF3563
MLIRTSFRNLPFARLASFRPADATSADRARAVPPRLTLLQRLDRWLWRQEQKGHERYLAQATDRFDLERRMRHIDRAGAFWFG